MILEEIYLPRKLTQQLLHLAQLSPHAEICGLIGADAMGRPVSCYPINNIATFPEQQFLLDASQQIAAMKQMREKNESWFAVYHSHPHAPAIPSNADLQQAAYPDALNFIISLNTKGILELRAFVYSGASAQEIPLKLIDN
jgi:[CysO sulfur-carrier protein]-S-L-cysteine hydrolase